jgi:hypothetical protein
MAAGQKGRQQAPNFGPLWERLQSQIDWYDAKAKANQRAYKVSKISIIVLAILIPVFAEYGFIPGFEESRAFLVGAAAGVIVLLEGLQVLNKWQENWILYRATLRGFAQRAASLRREGRALRQSQAGAGAEAVGRAHEQPGHGRAFQMVPRPGEQDRDDRGLALSSR